MTELAIGQQAPDFSLPCNTGGAHDSEANTGEHESGDTLSLDDYHGHYLALYFYPKDDTPGCTAEAMDFSAMKAKMKLINGRALGVSKDTLIKHDKFVAKHELTIPLVSDADSDMCERYGVWVEKNMYGRKYFGIERATFLISPTGKILQIWRKVRAKGHAEAVFKVMKSHSE